MSNAALGHDRNSDSLFSLNYQFWIAHTRDATLRANIGWHALYGHDGAGASFLRDACLFGIHNIANNSTFEHLWEGAFDLYRSCLLLHDSLSPGMVWIGCVTFVLTFYHFGRKSRYSQVREWIPAI